MSFKQPGASPTGGRLAKAVINLHRPYQVSATISSLNTVFCVNGHVGEVPTKFLLDSGAAISVLNLDVVKDKLLHQVNTCAVGANGTPWMWLVRPLLLYVYVISKWTTNSWLSATLQLIVYLERIFYSIMVLSWTVVIIRCLWGRIVKPSSQWTSTNKIQKVVMHPLVVYVHHVTWRFLEEQLCFLMQYFQPPAMPLR